MSLAFFNYWKVGEGRTCILDSVRDDEDLRLHGVDDHAAPLGTEGVEVQEEVAGPISHQLSLVLWEDREPSNWTFHKNNPDSDWRIIKMG